MTVLAVALSGCGAASRSVANQHRTDHEESVGGPAEIVVGGPIELAIEAPPAAVRAGGERLAEFKIGRKVTAQSGCLACHRIGDAGNNGPGADLTHTGSVLTSAGLARAILNPTAPMPSFSHMPAAKLRALVIFLSLLRR
jgi:menaquinol-cytochrome c reductase cytochrome b/c subunit